MHAPSPFSPNTRLRNQADDLEGLIVECTKLFQGHGCRRLANIREAWGRRDLVFLTQGGAFILLRCTPRASARDLRCVSVITAQGPFDRVLLVAASPNSRFPASTIEDLAAEAPILAQMKRTSAA